MAELGVGWRWGLTASVPGSHVYRIMTYNNALHATCETHARERKR
jgi:hypothetical protein